MGEKEQRARGTIQDLKSEITKLGQLVEQGAGLSINQENMVNQLVQEKNDLIKLRDMLQLQVMQSEQQHADLIARVQKLEAERHTGGIELADLKEQLAQRLLDPEMEQKRKEKLDKDVKEMRYSMDTRQSEIDAKKSEMNQNAEVISQLEVQLRAEKQSIESLKANRARLESSKDAYKKTNKDDLAACEKLSEEQAELQTQLKCKHDEISTLKSQKQKLSSRLEALKKKKAAGDSERQCLEASRASLKAEINLLAKDFEKAKKQAEQDNRQIQKLLRERDILDMHTMKADDRTKEQIDLVKRHEGQANSLAKDLQRWKTDLQLKLHHIHELDRAREKYASELAIAKSRYEDACEKLKKCDKTIATLNKSIDDKNARLKEQKDLYEAVRTDKNMYSKNLAEADAEIFEMEKRLRSLTHQIEQYKDEIKEKDKALVDEHVDLEVITKEIEKIKEKLDSSDKKQKKLQQVVDLQQQEIKKLEATIHEAMIESQNQRKEFDGVIGERNILGNQLIRRNEELALLYEKIKIQESTVKKGEIQYNSRLDEIKKSREGIANLNKKMLKAKQKAECVEDLKKEVYHLQRELLQERTKVKALSEELENPMNVHRWRKLEGSDPALYDLIQKVRFLQKRLIAKTEEVVGKDLEIQETDRQHRELTCMLGRQPGPEIVEQLKMYQELLATKNTQMRTMQGELATYQSQVGDYKEELERLTKELQEVKLKYYEQKKREHAHQDFLRGDTQTTISKAPRKVGFVGGGFSLAH